METLTAGYLSAIALGAVFGFQGSVSPGPLQTVIISESLTHGVRSSWRAATISLISDPIALVIAVCFVANVPNVLLAAIAFLGAAILCKIAWTQFKTNDKDFDFQSKPRLSLLTIWLTNILNPNLWVFSFTINAFQINHFYEKFGVMVAATYLVTFFVAICSCNLTTALIVSGSKRFLNVRWLVAINRTLAVFLLLVALRFVYLGLDYLDVFRDFVQLDMEAARFLCFSTI